MAKDLDKSIGDEATLAGKANRRPASEVSLGDERTLGDNRAGQDTVIDDIEIVDLEARYRVEGTLGQGGMGAVLLATDTRLDRKVAIKRILGEAAGNRMAVQRFLTEAKAIAALNHPNIVQIYDYGRAKDGPFLIMEYVDGGSLLDRCRESALPLDEAIDQACQLCDGLAKAHDLGIVHRDIKPANVLLTKDGTPKLTDFGLAKAEAGDHGQTMTGAVLGTPDFMPPEQRRDASLVDHRSDLWSLAATVYQMATGRSPKIIRFDLLPTELTKVLGKALEDGKDQRYQSARELRDALKTALLTATTVDELVEGACPGCGVKNESSRRFCRGCGESLEVECLSCMKPMPMWEEICGSCGSKQTGLVAERREIMAARQAEAEGLLGDFEFDRAADMATALRDEPHRKLRFLTGWAETFLEKVQKSRTDQTRHTVEALEESAKHEEAHDYLSALFALESIPQTLRSTTLPGTHESVATTLDRLKSLQKQANTLEAHIKSKLASKTLDDLLPAVEQLLKLQPNRPDVQKLQRQLRERTERLIAARDAAIRDAQSRIDAWDYAGATAVLSAITGASRTAEVDKLQEHAGSLLAQANDLEQRIRGAVAAKQFDGLLEPVERFLKLKPADKEVQKLRNALVDREEKQAAETIRRIEESRQLEKMSRFGEAADLLKGIAKARRSSEATTRLERCIRLAALRKMAMAALTEATAGRYGDALEQSMEYGTAIAQAQVEDREFAKLAASIVSAHADEVRTRKTLRKIAFAAAGIAAVAVLAVVGLWMRSTARASAVADAIAQSRWDDALAIDPANATAFVGRARQKLRATPADLEGAFADLDKAEKQPGGAAIVSLARAEAYAARAVAEARAGRLDRAVQDLQAAIRGGANQAILGPAQAVIAAAWIGRAQQAAAKGDGTALRVAAEAALAAGADRGPVMVAWQEYAKGRIAAIDSKGLELACTESKKAGLAGDDEVRWWIQYGTMAAATPHENAVEVICAVDKALAAGASASDMVPLRAKAMVLDALAEQKTGDTNAAVSRIYEASLLDAAIVRATLMNSANTALRAAVLADYRSKFNEAVGREDWTNALQIVAVAENVDKSEGAWMATALGSLPLSSVEPLPENMLASLSSNILLRLPPIRNSIGMELKLIPAGKFMLGAGGPEGPHEVTLTASFYIGIYEVTNEQFEQVMGTVPSKWKDKNLPVESVTWNDAIRFCRSLTSFPKEQEVGRRYRLPTNAEWEYACRAGSSEEFAFGSMQKIRGNISQQTYDNEITQHGWDSNNSGGRTHPVGGKLPNAWGLHDMHGNVAEWCNDWFGNYADDGTTDPRGPTKGQGRVIRGGDWNENFGAWRSAYRVHGEPTTKAPSLGFRVAVSISGGQTTPREAGQ